MSERTTILIQVSAAFKDAVGVWAQTNNVSTSEVIRQAVAQYISYDMSGDVVTAGRAKKYATKEDKLEAQRAKAKEHREFVKRLLAAFEHEEHISDAGKLQAYLDRKASPQ